MEMTNEKERLARVSISVTGMTCASCLRRVERAFSKKAGVAEASVNFAAEKASVSYEPIATSPDELIGAIQGFYVASSSARNTILKSLGRLSTQRRGSTEG